MATRLRSLCFLLGVIGLCASPLKAQEMVSVRVSTEPAGPRFMVDGFQYQAPQVFRWPVGSKHIVTIVAPTFTDSPTSSCQAPTDASLTQYSADCRFRYLFGGWQTSAGTPVTGDSYLQTITVDPKLTFVKAVFREEFKVNLVFRDLPGSVSTDSCMAMARYPGPPKSAGAGPGVVFLGGECFDRSGYVWTPAGSLALQAVPFDGHVFRGWTYDAAPTAPAQISAVQVRGPMMVTPRFEPAKRVRFHTQPAGLRVRIDNTEVLTSDPESPLPTYPMPGYFDWLGGSQHTVGGVSPQLDIDGRTWVFKEWSNGGGQNITLRVDEHTNVALVLTAKYVPGVHVGFTTEPAGLKLTLDGKDNPVRTFIWGVGMNYDISAPAEQTDAKGRKYLFKGWSNGGGAAQTITPEESQIRSGIRLIATFEAVPQAVIESSAAGIKISVNGAECASPCRLDRPAGTELSLAAPQTVNVNEVSRYEFAGWSDGVESATRTLTMGADAQTVTAMYRAAHKLTLAADPGEGASFKLEPASTDGFYPADTHVSITAESKKGWKFRRWGGDLEGTFHSSALAMSGPRMVTALLDRVPFVEPAGVRNAAAELSEPGVAAGLIAIYGGGLASRLEIGPSNPLAQTLAETVVLVGDRILPLIYVSPEQINAQLPSDLEPGEYELIVRSEGLADVSANFSIVRNAPGLFTNPVDGVIYAAALHEDGSPVTATSPARRNETVTLLGTGFGPYNRRLLDGFATPSSPAAPLADHVEVIANGTSIRPSFAGAAPGLVGLTATRFRVDSTVPAGSNELRVRVNGVESNTVILPVE